MAQQQAQQAQPQTDQAPPAGPNLNITDVQGMLQRQAGEFINYMWLPADQVDARVAASILNRMWELIHYLPIPQDQGASNGNGAARKAS